MEASPSQNHMNSKDSLANPSDSGIFSATTNTTIDKSDSSKIYENTDTEIRSDCSSPERKYFCPICSEMLTSQHEFTLHIRSHNNENEIQDNEKGYICRICSKVLSSSSSLDRHVLVHSGERPFHCKYCGDTFTTNGNMHRHMRTHSNKSENSYESDGSTDSGSSKSTEFNNNKVEKCNKRKNENLENENNKKFKEDYEESQSYTCPVCERDDFNSIVVLQGHLEDNHPDHPAKCNQCKQVFLNNKMLSVHKVTVHENKLSKQPVVGFKDLTFVDFSSQKFPHIARRECEINLHKSAGNGDLNFLCKNCNRAFPCSNSLEIHEENCVILDPPKATDLSTISQGDIRRKDFFSRLNLITNSPEKQSILATSQNLREQFAKVIDNTKDLADIQSILSNINLQQLQNKQNNDLRLSTPKHLESASECQKTEEEETQDLFAIEFRKMKLRGEFPCRLCTAVFPNLRALKGHNRAHLNGSSNGTYYCNMCPHSSIDKAALIRHMRTHNGDRPYECALCNYAFTTKANCERHLRNRHAKTTREDVKKSIIYHPSEDPTNDDINKITSKGESKKSCISFSAETNETNPNEKMHRLTPKLPDIIRTGIPDIKPEINLTPPNIPVLLPDLPAPRMYNSINEIIRSENLRNLQKNSFRSNGVSSFIPSAEFIAAQNLSNKIQVKNIDVLKEPNSSYENESEDEYVEEEDDQEQPLNLVLDLSKKKTVVDDKHISDDEEPQDLTTKNFDQERPKSPPNMNQIFAQNLLKTQPKIDPAMLYATQLALYRGNFPSLPNWSGFPINPLFFSTLNATLPQNAQEIKERMQRFQLCGGSVISEDFKNVEHMQQPSPLNSPLAFNGYNIEQKTEMRLENNFSTPKMSDVVKPLSLNIENTFGDNFSNLQSPISTNKSDPLHSPSSVKMVIKNGVLMPKQKQRRYRTERPFTCEHCSARFTLRSNMERHIKQQHPQFWSQRQRGTVGTPGRKPQILPMKSNYCDLNVPNYETPKLNDYNDTKEYLNEKLKFAILAQQLKAHQGQHLVKEEENEEDCELVIDEADDKIEMKTDDSQNKTSEPESVENKCLKNDENQDLVSVSRLLDNASQQQFKDYFKRDGEEHEIGIVSEEDEEGLVASGSTSEENISGAEETKTESDIIQPVKKKSAYSLAPNRVSCPYCSRKFPWTSSLRRHILTHTGQKPFKCSHCPLLFTTKSNCDRHLLRKHGNAATTITNDTGNPNYLMRNVPERPFKCSNCPSSTFSTYSNLKKHISCKHATNAQGDDIKAQGYEAGSSEDEKIPNNDPKVSWELQVTSNKVTSEPVLPNSDLPFKCHLCEGSFSERQEALDHIKDKHSSEYDLLLSKNALDLNATTPDEVPHQDDEDGEFRGRFPDYSNRKVICAFCMRRFWSAEDLRRHMRTHTGERPFSCDICRRRFTLKHSMLRHRKKHNVNFEHDTGNSDEDANNVLPFSSEKKLLHELNTFRKTDESDGGNESGDLISNLLGLRDRSIIDKVLTASADDAAKLLGVRNGAK